MSQRVQPIRNGFSFDVDELETATYQSFGMPVLDGPKYLAQNTERTLELLSELDVKATFFINGASVAPHPGLIGRIASQGHEIAAHSYSHRFLDTYRDRQEFRDDLARCVDLIGNETGTGPIGYRAPGNTLYANRHLALETLRELGFVYDSSVPSVANRKQHGYHRGPARPFRWSNGIVELPMPHWKILGMPFPLIGAHALRLAPYWCTANGLSRLNEQGQTGFLYAHSFELFKNPVRWRCLTSNFPKHAIYLARCGACMERKIRQLLNQFKFVPYREILIQELDSRELDVVDVECHWN